MELTVKLVLTADPALLSTLQALAGFKAITTEPPAATKLATGKVKELSTAKAATVDAASEAATKSSSASTQNGATTDQGQASGLTLESLRALAVPKSKAGHKDAIKKWLSEKGYPSLGDLQEKDFNSFHEFIAAL